MLSKAREKGFYVFEKFLSPDLCDHLARDASRALSKSPFYSGHFDGAIVNYKECTIDSKKIANFRSIDYVSTMVKQLFFSNIHQENLESPHVIFLRNDGYIKPHVDNVSQQILFSYLWDKYCGGIIAGISLLSTRSMAFNHEEGMEQFEAQLPPGSLYIQRYRTGFWSTYRYSLESRYCYTHAIQPGISERMSIIFRSKS